MTIHKKLKTIVLSNLIHKKSNTFFLIFFFIIFLINNNIYCQTPGFIYKTASSTLGRSILDPNSDGYTSASTSGFTTTGTSPKLKETNSELRMIPMPVIMEEPLGDPVTGGTGGQTDIVSAGGSESIYLLKRTVNSVDYLIVRFRLGSASTASKGFSLLLETDRNFGTALSTNNLGFDREVVYETGSNGRIAIYSHTIAGTTLLKSYNVNEFSQRSYASSTVGGKQNAFYDFCVPLRDIDATEFVRLCAVTVSSAGSGITGSISDFNGINDKNYGSNSLKLQEVLINNFPELNFDEMDENFDPSTLIVKTLKPTITEPINNGANSVTGFCAEPDGTVITVYKDGVSIGTTTVSGGAWTLSGISPTLLTGQVITASANASGKNPSDLSNAVIVGGGASVDPSFICYNHAPQITGYHKTNNTFTITWDHTKSLNTTVNTVKFYIYKVGNTIPFVTTSALTIAGPTYTISIGSHSSSEYYAVAERGCLSNPSIIKATSVSGPTGTLSTPTQTTITAPDLPEVVTAFSGTKNVRVINKHSTGARLSIFVNGQFKDSTTSLINTNDSFNFQLTNLKVNDFITAYAHRTVRSNRDSVVVTTNTQSNPPIVTGVYFPSSSGTVTITGTSPSPQGTTIKVFLNGTQIGTAVVDAFGQWELDVNTGTNNLITGGQISATAIAGGKSESILSNIVTVLPAPPAAPTVNGPILAGITSNLSGTYTGSSDSIVIFIDGVRIGKATLNGSGNWTLNGVNLESLYLGGNVMAINYLNGSPANSTEVPIIGPDNFLIENFGGGAIPTQTAGKPFNIKTTARDGIANGNNTFTNYNTANLYSDSLGGLTQGAGPSSNFGSGVLNSHTITLTKAGTTKLVTVSQDLPTVFGSTYVTIVPDTAFKLILVTPASKYNSPAQNFITQPVVALADAYGNIINNDPDAGSVTVSVFKQNGSESIDSDLELTDSNQRISNLPTSGAGQFTYSGMSINKNGQYIIKYTPSKPGIKQVYDTVNVSNTWIWYGTVDTGFSKPANWVPTGSGSGIPSTGDNVEFYTTPTNSCFLDINRTLGSIIIASTGTASNAIFNLNGKELTLQGELLLTNLGKIDARASGSRLILAGNRNEEQILPKDRFVDNTIRNLTINNSSGVSLPSSSNIINISNNLTFSSGVIRTLRSSNAIVFLNGSNHNGANNTSHIEGKCSKVGNTSFVFPIGKTLKYAPCGISNQSELTDKYTAEYFPINYTNTDFDTSTFINRKINSGTAIPAKLFRVSSKEYWAIDRNTGTSPVDVSLYWYDAGFSEITSLTGLTIVHYNKTSKNKWENSIGNGNIIPKDSLGIVPDTLNYVPNAGSLTLQSVSDFSPFTFGDENNFSILPIKLLNFKGKSLSMNQNLIEWQSLNDINLNYFQLYKSINNIEWQLVDVIKRNSFSEYINSYSIINYDLNDIVYYKLKSFDKDGLFTTSNIIIVRKSELKLDDILLYPNPNNGQFSIKGNGKIYFEIFNHIGKLMHYGNIENSGTIHFDHSGVYFIKIKQGDLEVIQKLIIL